jgi:hypothetical protein
MKLSVQSALKSLDTRDILLKYAVIILFGWLIFWFDDQEILNERLNTLLVILIASSKTTFFVVQSLRKIGEVIDKNVAYFKFLLFMSVNIFVIIVSYAIDFFSLYTINHHHFSGLQENTSNFRLMFEFLYLSMLGFNNLGFYDVVPIGFSAKILVMMEIVIYYFAIVLILSDFISLKDSILEERLNKSLGHKKENGANDVAQE